MADIPTIKALHPERGKMVRLSLAMDEETLLWWRARGPKYLTMIGSLFRWYAVEHGMGSENQNKPGKS